MINTINAPKTIVKSEAKLSVWDKYLRFCEAQEKNRFVWMALALLSLTCIFVPLALFSLEGSLSFPIAVSIYVVLLMGNLLAYLSELNMKISLSLFFLASIGILLTPLVIQLIA